MPPWLRIDPDLVVFLFTAGKILVAGPAQLRRNLRFIPAEYEFEDVSHPTLTEKQSKFFGRFDQKLVEMNYRPVLHLPHQELRLELDTLVSEPGRPRFLQSNGRRNPAECSGRRNQQ